MKQRIEIRNFGPIKHVDLDISDYTLFIGPNASGKSTIAKLVYFFKSLGNLLAKTIRFSLAEKNSDEIFHSFRNSAELLLQKYWDVDLVQNDLRVIFSINKQGDDSFQKIAEITKKDKVYFFDFSYSVIEEFSKLGDMYISKYQSSDFSPETGIAQQDFIQNFSSLFNDTQYAFFIPAGRQLLSSSIDKFIDLSRTDVLMKQFINVIDNSIRPLFSEGFSSSIFNSGATPKISGLLELAQKIALSILKGDFFSNRNGERIYFAEQQFVRLHEASSGQQESLWILNFILATLGLRNPLLAIIEEPEAHLYPETQRDVTHLISLLANQPGNQVMITTHSPYILSALNNLLYAHKVGKVKPDETAEIIDPLLWVDIDRVAAYHVDGGEIHDIVDRESGMIDAEAIDSASRTIFDEFDKILQQED